MKRAVIVGCGNIAAVHAAVDLCRTGAMQLVAANASADLQAPADMNAGIISSVNVHRAGGV